MNKEVEVIGGGLAGSEASYQLAKRGYKVKLYDIKPTTFTEAHTNKNLCELVCSNSLKSDDAEGSSSGILKAELLSLGSMVLEEAYKSRVKAGSALAVDRDIFALNVTNRLKDEKNIEIISREIEDINLENNVIIATGPLTTTPLAKSIANLSGESLFFFDAVAPICSTESIDFNECFIADRYGKGEGDGDYINCPMTKEQYEAFYEELILAKTVVLKDFENKKIFESCMPIEVMAKRGEGTLRFGMLKPVGLIDPRTDKRPYCLVQLRSENNEKTCYNLVGFQTNLLFGEQKRVFSMIPALKNADFLKYGVMHKNIFINAPKVLNADFSMKNHSNIFFAGQITGVEGYVESIASGLMAGINMSRRLDEKEPLILGGETIIGSLTNHIIQEVDNYQPMNSNYGILKPLEEKTRDKDLKKKMFAERSKKYIEKIKETEKI